MKNWRSAQHSLKTSIASFVFLFAIPAIASQSYTLMSYNVENLFDTAKDTGKEDWAYLPRAFKNQSPEVQKACSQVSNPRWRRECFNMDWSSVTLRTKVGNVGRVIKSSFRGAGPDILVLQEIENIQVLEILNSSALRGLGYRTQVLVEGPDKRGIDTAILSRLPLIKKRSHSVRLPSGSRPTRDILEVVLNAGGKKLSVFANHWPSQGNPTSYRVAAANTLLRAARNAHREGSHSIAVGDFNSLLDEIRGDVGQTLVGNDSPYHFKDGIELRLGNDSRTPTALPGTHWYRGKWSFLDRVYFFNGSLSSDGIKMDWQQINVHAPSFALREHEYRRRDGSVIYSKIPFRFNAEEKIGYSDHMPLIFSFKL